MLVFSVGGGSEEKNISANLVNAVRAAKSVGAAVLGVVGRDGGFTAANADACVIVPTVDASLVTPLTEAYQAVVWHLLVSHPLILKIFADGASLPGILEMSRNPLISGFTTNPTLMRKAGISDYEAFAREALQVVTMLPISFEVFSDELREMERQALKIASWADNVYVKIPSTNTHGESTHEIAARLAQAGVKLNVTAMTTPRM